MQSFIHFHSSHPRSGRVRPRLLFAVLNLAAIVAAFAFWRACIHTPADAATTYYAGSQTCMECHADQHALWHGSNHQLAQQPVDADAVRPAFTPERTVEHGSMTSRIFMRDGAPVIETQGPGGELTAYEPEYVLAWKPLRQFLIPFPKGRLQVTELAWDPAENEWFNVFGDEDRRPGEWGHWTGRGMNWNSMCAECHTTDHQKNYLPQEDAYRTTWLELGVGCEACHGPYGGHADWKQRHPDRPWPGYERISPERIMDNCAACHARREKLTDDFKPGETFSDHYRIALPGLDPTFYPDGQIRDEDFEYSSFIMSRMYHEGVTCLDCHNAHSGELRYPVEDNRLCMQCHQDTIDPVAHGGHEPDSVGNRCVECHMPQTTYMERHPRRDHGFIIPDPWLTREYGIPNACARCHDEGTDWLLEQYNEWYPAEPTLPSRRRARTLAAAYAGDASVIDDVLDIVRDDPYPAWRTVALNMLQQWPARPDVLTTLRGAVEDASPLVRAAALRTLELTGQAGPLAQPALDDPSRLVRLEAAWALRAGLDLETRPGRELLEYLEIRRDQPSGTLQLGQFAWDRGDLPAAEEHIRRTIEWEPTAPEPHRALAIILQQQGDAAAAVQALQRAVALSDQSPDFLYSLALAYSDSGQLDKTIQTLERVTERDPEFARAWYNLGLAYSQQERPLDAVRALQRAEAVDPVSPDYSYARATILARRGEVRPALEAANEALQRNPHFAPADQLIRQLEGSLGPRP